MSEPAAEPTFSELFSRAVGARGMTLSELRNRLVSRGHQVSLATLSYWRSGQREPERVASLEALPVIEELLGLSDNALTDALGRSQRRGRVRAFNELLAVPLDEVMRSEVTVTRVASHLTVDLDAAGGLDFMRHRWIVVAERGEVAGMTLFLRAGLSRDLSVTAVAGCSIQTVGEPAEGSWSYYALFDKPLRIGESTAFEVEIRLTEAELDTDYALIAEELLEDAMIWVRFHPDKVPARCWVKLTEQDLEFQWPVDLAGGHTVHQRQTAFGPGRLGVQWEW